MPPRLPPRQAWALALAREVALVDLRSAEERRFVGHVPGGLHVAWATGTSLKRNPRFVKELESRAGGKRSARAAEAAAQAGFNAVFNVLEGFEGEADGTQQRGHINGWRWHSLPWVQD
nr:rhodanese-like domain-containing protein [Rubrivivax rivuli]